MRLLGFDFAMVGATLVVTRMGGRRFREGDHKGRPYHMPWYALKTERMV